MRKHRGFTLVELMVALVITGVVALLVYGTASAGVRSREIQERRRVEVENVALLRSLLVNGLRHLGTSRTDAPFFLDETERGQWGSGRGAQRLSFHTRGVGEPLGASREWIIQLSQSATGLVFSAAANSVLNPETHRSILAVISSMQVDVLGRAESDWRTSWSQRDPPLAVRIELFDHSGKLAGPPIFVVTQLENLR